MTESTTASSVPITMSSRPLYDSTAVGIAAFLGSPLAGSALMALNYRRLGKPSVALRTVMAGVLATVLLFGIAYLVPEDQPAGRSVLSVWGLIGTVAVARNLQGSIVAAHRSAGGKVGSRWFGAAIGILVGVTIATPFVMADLAGSSAPGTRLSVDPFGEIYYSGTATEADARSLGDALKNEGFFKGPATVELSKGLEGTVLSFVVQDGTGDNPGLVGDFESVARAVAPSVGGLPIKLRLLTTARDIQRESLIQ
jgi:hypothetical protein